MSVIVKGMKMPDSCFLCYFYNGLGCKATGGMFPMFSNVAIRREDCPLVEVSPHGRLIDADAALKLLRNLGSRDYRREKGTIMDAMKMLSYDEYTPTIIPAEPPKEES